MFLTWWRALSKKLGSKRSRRWTRPRTRLWAEPLEDRTLLATSAFFSMPTNLSGNQGTVVTVPLSIGHLFDSLTPVPDQGLAGADVVLTYDPTAFSVSNADISPGALLTNPPPAGSWTFTPNTATPGEIDISLFTSSPAADITSTVGGVLANINFHIKGSAPTGNSTI